MANKVQLIKQEIERIIEEETPISKGSDYYHGVKESMEKLLQFIDSLPEESTDDVNYTPENEDLEEEFHSWMKENCDDNGFFNQLELARHFAEWQRKQDESRRNANIALANTDVPKDKDLEIAFEDIWSDVENCVYDLNKLSNEQKYKLKNAHHDTFEAGVIWHKQQIIKDAVDAFVNTYENTDDSNYVEFVTEQSPYKFKETEKCKLIIIKEEQQ